MAIVTLSTVPSRDSSHVSATAKLDCPLLEKESQFDQQIRQSKSELGHGKNKEISRKSVNDNEIVRHMKEHTRIGSLGKFEKLSIKFLSLKVARPGFSLTIPTLFEHEIQRCVK